MSETLLSLGLDVGTTSTQMILSRLDIGNRAGSFAVPEMVIEGREVLYKSPVHFTPLIREELVDAEALRRILDEEYRSAGITKADVDTGAIIITGETSRKENARAVLDALSDYAGDFVVATAGPDLESVLAAKGAGALEASAATGKTVLHMDIGGGTSNLALIEDGRIMSTGCLNIGGRLLKIDSNGKLTYVSPVLKGIFHKAVGDYVNQDDARKLAITLAEVLEMAAGLREQSHLLAALTTAGTTLPAVTGPVTLSFSGGVADCIRQDHPFGAFGDLGPELGRAIRESRLCLGPCRMGAETIRATVIGAGCHSAQLSGSTVFHQNVAFPLKNLPVVTAPEHLSRLDSPGVLVVPGEALDFSGIRDLAKKLAASAEPPIYLAASGDMAKALGVQLALALGDRAEILCIDRVRLQEGDYLDVGTPIGPALPVVVKTLVLET